MMQNVILVLKRYVNKINLERGSSRNLPPSYRNHIVSKKILVPVCVPEKIRHGWFGLKPIHHSGTGMHTGKGYCMPQIVSLL